MNLRKKIVAANWKMNMTQAESAEFMRDLLLELGDIRDVDVVIVPPFTAIAKVTESLGSSQNIKVGAQNMHWERSGAFTGEISAALLRDLFVRYVVLGHSERRQYFGETDETVAKRVHAALEAGLFVIACIGETEQERDTNQTEEVLRRQLSVLEPDDNLVLAYEPVWAIGTGKTATPQLAQDAHAFIKSQLEAPVLYGGSVKPDNAAELLAQPAVDGALVGGASLELEPFTAICRAAIRS
jgi:triosephosphate isomerase